MKKETLLDWGFAPESTDSGWLYSKSLIDYAVYVNIADDGQVQVARMPYDHEVPTTVVTWSRPCDELFALIERWGDVTSASFN